jgi:aerobic-type carbon monoxide dehydrogenase small subunit (CoxS/CutS family)
MAKITELRVNDTRHPIDVDPQRSLLSVLRDDLGLTGSKYGCGEGQCGACTVLIEGQATRSCITPVAAAAGRRITTIEGLEKNGHLHPVQAAFLESDALQCGYCTPGMIMSAVALLKTNPHPSEAQITHSLEGNVCRCGAYPRILAAVRRAATPGGKADE